MLRKLVRSHHVLWAILATPILLAVTDRADAQNWQLTFDDEFNGNSVDTSKWSYGLPWGNYTIPSQEQQAYTFTNPGVNNANVYESDGALHLTATKTRSLAYDITHGDALVTQPYTSGCLTTSTKFSQAYGKFEISAQLPAGQGLWPAFWMLSTTQGLPEVDVFENLGNNTNKLYFTDHYDPNNSSTATQGTLTGPDFSAGPHTYSLIWTPSGISWYVDNALCYSVTNAPGKQYSPTTPMNLLLNLAVGGPDGWPGSPSAGTAFPATFSIDYVRAYTEIAPEPSTFAVMGLVAMPVLLSRRRRLTHGHAPGYNSRTVCDQASNP